ncbi:hypothetical protein PGB34_16900 [Xenophilus arseniciresistens]|uniref:Uncharacterized protein n=1 Tax=Xenophilus arseniciresistens TaxID=1283306 RepID=A0AAE3N9B0_9BURK|nr:hypothetical protein [Xenophilus arseniciresistens]MDA7418045.1 hypothetical protein [Xenophilus arseniciresistens]
MREEPAGIDTLSSRRHILQIECGTAIQLAHDPSGFRARPLELPMIPDGEAFERFVSRHKKKLRGIAYKTAGEQQYEDVVQEAWLMACTLRAEDSGPLDLSDEIHQQRLLAHLCQHLVRYTELTVRHAVRLEHGTGSDGSEDGHPLARTLTSDGGRSVLDALMERDAEQLLERELQAHGSQAAAYIQLLRHFDDHMEAVALHLRVSVSYAYRRCAHARRLAQHLQHIAVPRSDALPDP